YTTLFRSHEPRRRQDRHDVHGAGLRKRWKVRQPRHYRAERRGRHVLDDDVAAVPRRPGLSNGRDVCGEGRVVRAALHHHEALRRRAMKLMKCAAVVAVLGGVAPLAGAVTIAELLASPDTYNGKTVTVTGTVAAALPVG